MTEANKLDEPTPAPVTVELIDSWARNVNTPVALHLKQRLVSVEESEYTIIYPPTYADIGYNIDTMADGTMVAAIDSVGSQANRMEPLFKEKPLSSLVPQIEIELHSKSEDGKTYSEKRSILDVAHRIADAVVYAAPTLALDVTKAFRALRKSGDAGLLCALAPTSLVFGVWDSRGGTSEKRPRLVRSVIRAWDVQPLHTAAQFNSVWKSLNAEQQAELEKEAKSKKVKLSVKGFADAPATFRKLGPAAAKNIPEFRNGSVNSERRVLGGVLVNGSIERDVTVNLVALRAIRGSTEEETMNIRRYLLSLALLAATVEIDFYLREGCLLRISDDGVWREIPRRGQPRAVDLLSNVAQQNLLDYADKEANKFRPRWPKTLVHKFDLKEAKKLLAKKEEDEESEM